MCVCVWLLFWRKKVCPSRLGVVVRDVRIKSRLMSVVVCAFALTIANLCVTRKMCAALRYYRFRVAEDGTYHGNRRKYSAALCSIAREVYGSFAKRATRIGY